MSSTSPAPEHALSSPADLFPHWTSETLRISDLDRMRHVNNVSTISLYEDGWHRFVDDGEMGETPGTVWRVDYLGVDFRAQLFYRDDLQVGTRVSAVDGARLRVSHVLRRNGDTVGGEIVGAAERLVTPVDRHTGEPVDFPARTLGLARKANHPGLRALFKAPEGDPPLSDADYPIWRDDILRFSDLDADERIGRLTQLKLVESGRIGLIENVGPPSDDSDVIWMAAHVALNFLAWPDRHAKIRTRVRVEGFGNSSCHLRHTIESDGKVIANGGAVVALTNRKSLNSVRIPDNLRSRLEKAPDSNVPLSDRYDPAKIFRE